MNKLSKEKRIGIISALIEGNSIRGTSRMVGVAKGTVLKLLADIGLVCSEYQDKHIRNLKSTKIQCDEIWSFCYAKQKNLPKDKQGKNGYGDVWTWSAICADTKIVPCWVIGSRDAQCAYRFMKDLKSRLANRVQLTTDGHRAYLEAVERTFGYDIDYAMLVKLYGNDPSQEKRYSPAQCTGISKKVISGRPDSKHISTSYIERQNLTMRMHLRRFTRLTNAFSKKIENLSHAISLHYMYYNFARIHRSLRVTPAMEAGISSHVWDIADIVDLLEKKEGSN